MRWGMVINLAKCMRCHACVAACRIEHFLPMDITWVKLIAYEVDEGGVVDVSTYPVRCNQCADAPCVHACPTEASHQREDGIVIVDSNKCIGCRYCVIACPYQNRTFYSKDKDPGYFPGYERTRVREDGPEALPASAGHHREVQLLRRAHRRRHVPRSHARRRPRRHAGVRQHLSGAGAHVRRPGRPGQPGQPARSASTAASSCAPSTAPSPPSGTSTTGSAATTTRRRARPRRAATCSTSAPWTATPTGASTAKSRPTRR